MSQTAYSVSQTRSEMISLQQNIHKLNIQFDELISKIPPDLIKNVDNLAKVANDLHGKMDSELNFDYQNEISLLNKKINKLQSDFEALESKLNNRKVDHSFDKALSDLERRIMNDNISFLEKLQKETEQEINESFPSIEDNSSNTLDLHLSANFENSNNQNSRIIKIETSAKLDPEIHFRVQRHLNRIALVEKDLDNILSQNAPIRSIKQNLNKELEIAKNNETAIIQLEAGLENFELTLKDYSKDKFDREERKRKMEANEEILNGVTNSEFSSYQEGIITLFSDFTDKLNATESKLNDSLFELNDQIDGIEGKIKNYYNSANNFKSLLQMTDSDIIDTENRISKIEGLNTNSSKKLLTSDDYIKEISKKGMEKLNDVENQIKDEIQKVRESVLALIDSQNIHSS